MNTQSSFTTSEVKESIKFLAGLTATGANAAIVSLVLKHSIEEKLSNADSKLIELLDNDSTLEPLNAVVNNFVGKLRQAKLKKMCEAASLYTYTEQLKAFNRKRKDLSQSEKDALIKELKATVLHSGKFYAYLTNQISFNSYVAMLPVANSQPKAKAKPEAAVTNIAPELHEAQLDAQQAKASQLYAEAQALAAQLALSEAKAEAEKPVMVDLVELVQDLTAEQLLSLQAVIEARLLEINLEEASKVA